MWWCPARVYCHFQIEFNSFSIGVRDFHTKLVADLVMGGLVSSILLGGFEESLMLSCELEEAPARLMEKPMVVPVQSCFHRIKLSNLSKGFPGTSIIVPVDVDVQGGPFVLRVFLFEDLADDFGMEVMHIMMADDGQTQEFIG